jgi:hypothetical protein
MLCVVWCCVCVDVDVVSDRKLNAKDFFTSLTIGHARVFAFVCVHEVTVCALSDANPIAFAIALLQRVDRVQRAAQACCRLTGKFVDERVRVCVHSVLLRSLCWRPLRNTTGVHVLCDLV